MRENNSMGNFGDRGNRSGSGNGFRRNNSGFRRNNFDRVQEKCITLNAPSAEKNVKFHLNQLKEDLFTVVNVSKRKADVKV